MKKIVLLISVFMIGLGLAACDASAPVEASEYYVAIDINPSIEFIVNGNDEVVSYNLLNEDAEILLADVDLIGMNVDEAIELFIELATEAGYIEVESEENAVLITVLCENDEDMSTYRERIKNRVLRFFARSYIQAQVFTEDFTREDLVLQAEELGVSPGKLAIALLAEESSELTLEELLEMPVKDIMAIVKEYHQEAFAEFTAEKRATLKEIKDQLIAENRAQFQQHLEENPELTEEEIQALVQQYRQQTRQMIRQEWQEQMEEWRTNRNQDEEEEIE